jgi:glycosyltransferase involved in cell wall biosynthesis
MPGLPACGRGRSPVRVLLVNAHGADPTCGGAERYVRDLAFGLTARGHEITVLSAFPAREDVGINTHVMHRSDWRDDPLRRVRNHAGDVIAAPWPRLRAALEAASPDLVHTSNLPGIGSGIWEVARRLRIPVVHTLHDYHLLCPRATLTRRNGVPCEPSPLLCGVRTRRLVRWAGAVQQLITISEHVRRAHSGLFPTAQERMIRIPLARTDQGPQASPHSPPAALGYLGRLAPTKGVELLLAAGSTLANEGIELRVAGDGPLRQRVAAAGVRYVGWVQGATRADFLSSCDLGVVPSLWEEPGGPPYVVCDWLSAGRPVLVTRRGGLREAAQGGGVVAFHGSPGGLVDVVLRLRDPDEWRRLLAAVPAVDGDADMQRWLDQHEAAYEAAVEHRPEAG